MAAASGESPAGSAAGSFRLQFLGRQALNRPTNTGFGSVQKPLRDIFMAHATGREAGDKAAERTVQFDGHDMQIRFWDPGARRFQQEVWPIDCVTYLDLVLFHTVKGKKRHFGYFRRHSDSTDVVPDSVLIPLHKKEAKSLAKCRHGPLLCFLIRRPYGIQFLECHAYQVESEADGLAFIAAFDRQSRAKLQDEKRSHLFNYAPWQPDGSCLAAGINKWASQPALAMSGGLQLSAMVGVSDLTAPTERLPQPGERQQQQQQKIQQQQQQQQQQQEQQQRPHWQSASNVSSPAVASAAAPAAASGSAVSLVPSSDGAFVVVDQQMRRSASGTIFDKYKELQAFNIPEHEYMGFQEMQQQLEQRRQQRLQQPQQPQQQPQPQQQQQPQQQPQQHQQPQQQRRQQQQSGVGIHRFPSDGNISRQVQLPSSSSSLKQQQLQQQSAIQRRFRPTAAAQTVEHRPSTILEEGNRTSQMTPTADGGGGGSGGSGGGSSVASLVSRFEQIQQRPAPTAEVDQQKQQQQQQQEQQEQQLMMMLAKRPVARVPPTTRESEPHHSQHNQQQQQQADKAKPVPVDQHRIHRSVSSRVQQQQQQQQQHHFEPPASQQRRHPAIIGSTPDFVANSGLGYLP